ncbi:type I restriction enzyme, S subunit [Prauserella aidingensis]|uniref:restriction endonuclease subunit S n=1 Tax=Prauserella aidingensis TaxID=387890 RepID=UPI0020A2B2DB|nr:restriction endonuclease subunit S [Prauserella aidingensis]MCP2254313.1 type I restriction enzyme, S subunit [Prauserella aidingensis]
MKFCSLGDIAEIDRKTASPSSLPPSTPYLGLEHIERGGRIIGNGTVVEAGLTSAKHLFTPDHVLFGKLRPNLGKVATPSYSGVCSTDILPIRPSVELDRRYLALFLTTPHMVDHASSRATGANLPRLSPEVLKTFQVPLVSIDEQRRIAGILDQADAIRAKRRQLLDHLDTLTQSIFHDMFGRADIALHEFASVVDFMRSGVSPSTRGNVEGTVLTLASVTQGRFDPSARKSAKFGARPSETTRIDERDFLICRGNGNRSLVGVGVHPSSSRHDLVFPDTVIAARLKLDKVNAEYLEAAWKQSNIRHQIEAAARTTNGTHKVNQAVLGAVMVPLPSMDRQREFAARVEQVNAQRAVVQRALDADNELFESLQARAFRGEL